MNRHAVARFSTGRSDFWKPFCLLAFGLAVCVLFLPPSSALYLSYLAVASVAAALLLLLVYRFEYFAAVALFLYYYVILIIGVMVDESGAYMLEIQRTGYPNGSTAAILLFCTIFIIFSFWSYSRTRSWLCRLHVLAFNKKVERYGSILIVSLVVSASLYHLIRYSSPLLLGVERSTYFTDIAPAWSQQLYSATSQSFVIALGLFFFTRHKIKRIFSGILVVTYIFIVVFVFGVKFSGLVLMAALTLIFYVSRGGRLNARMMFIGIICVILSCYLIFLQYGYLGRDPLQFVWLRIAMQGQIAWSVFSDPHIHMIAPSGEFCFFNCWDGYGINWLLTSRYLSADMAAHYATSGSNLTGFNPATAIFMLGLPIALLLHVAISCLIGFASALLVEMIRRGYFLATILAYRLYLSIYYIYMATDPAPLQSNFTLILIFIAVIYILCAQISRLAKGDVNGQVKYNSATQRF